MAEQKKLMIEMLKFVDRICRKNNIKYSMFGGSLIGTVRHEGFIPWDDDIDIILTKQNYDKLKSILDKETGRFQTLKYNQGGKCFGFLKLIDTKTMLKEPGQAKFNPDYGVFLDIFCFHNTSDDLRKRLWHYRKIWFFKSLLRRQKLDFKNYSVPKNLYWILKNTTSKIIGFKLLNFLFGKSVSEYDGIETDYLIPDWPYLGVLRETQLKKNTDEYIDAKFENLRVMIFENYDEILKTTFGNYLELPPESERVPKHEMKVWWREDA